MSNAAERAAEDQYEAQNDGNPGVPAEVNDNSYIPSDKSREAGNIPIVTDEQANKELDDNAIPSNSDAQLAQDDMSAIDHSNIVQGRTRGAKPVGSLSEGPDENDLPSEVNATGRSDMTRGAR